MNLIVKKTSIQLILISIVILFVIFSGCLKIPFLSDTDMKLSDEMHLENYDSYEEVILLTPTPTPIISTVEDWNPYERLPPPPIPSIRPSIHKEEVKSTYRIPLNTTHTNTTRLYGYAVGRILNITSGPFSLTFTVTPEVNNPQVTWARYTIEDPWGTVLATEGYDRGYSTDLSKTITLYREGISYLILEGEFVTVDYILKTRDPGPEVTPTPAYSTLTEEEEWMMEMGYL